MAMLLQLSRQMASLLQRVVVPALAAGRPVIVFCLADCWMSWNAALRLHRAGLNVAWYGAGRDGWAASGLALAPVIPFVNKEK